MSARIGQRLQEQQSRWDVSVQLRREAALVGTQQTLFMPVRDSIGHLAWTLQVPAVVPASGAWSIVVPELTVVDNQVVGIVIVDGTAVYPLSLVNGVLTTNASINAGSTVTVRGSVEV